MIPLDDDIHVIHKHANRHRFEKLIGMIQQIRYVIEIIFGFIELDPHLFDFFVDFSQYLLGVGRLPRCFGRIRQEGFPALHQGIPEMYLDFKNPFFGFHIFFHRDQRQDFFQRMGGQQ